LRDKKRLIFPAIDESQIRNTEQLLQKQGFETSRVEKGARIEVTYRRNKNGKK
jgi:hypothetical protein